MADNLSGFLVVDKPRDWTSSDVVRKLKGAFRLGKRRVKIGHGGTLDPMATGVLPICIGAATRFSRYLLDGDKTYRATVTFGVATDTYDADGEVVSTADAGGVSIAELEQAILGYIGEIEQVPPIYSAIKVGGRRMYSVARAGGTAELPSRRVKVDAIDILKWEVPELEVEITCGKGFYVRSFAHDLGADLGCGAHLTALRRTRAGVFAGRDALTLETLIGMAADDAWSAELHAIDSVLGHLPRVDLCAKDSAAFRHGRQVDSPVCEFAGDVRVYGFGGRLLGVGRRLGSAGTVAPSVVIASA